MTKILALSEANAIAFHGMALIAKSELAISATDIADITNSSRHHTSKVMQRLVKAGLIGSTRGPSGGFFLKKDASEIKIIDILEALEGKVEINDCPVDNAICPFGSCLMGGICYEIGTTLITYMREHTLQDMVNNISNEDVLLKK
ncbi:MAG: Rrf2 family transcriptional regulator [Bacteroidales bacterium]|jgi:Rrf2 family protein|nr:Rrf2 family transcriptional regulator [Bacteroidales bacterium]MCK9499293.1 Rrf2 family transcriptional regulator [Bacteroidales bacterium]MDY0313664.1 Rrf2 family transcriptional regulator [Bacteroidales bacterium]NLB85940.1 Rrf2 family transcriptional regulator [Bacteroidales bacterium]